MITLLLEQPRYLTRTTRYLVHRIYIAWYIYVVPGIRSYFCIFTKPFINRLGMHSVYRAAYTCVLQ